MSRFMRREITKVWFVPTLTAPTGPSHTEISAGTDLTDDIAEINGFVFSNSPIMTPDLGAKFVNQIPGEDTTEDSGLVFYQDKDNTDIYDALVKGDDGFIVFFDIGYAGSAPAAADVVDVWPVTISSKSKHYTAGNEAAQFEVKFAMTKPPSNDAICT